MIADAIVAMRRRRPAIPWTVPIAVHFACNGKPLFGCRLCILRHGLRRGDHSHLFDTEAEAVAHIERHAVKFEVPEHLPRRRTRIGASAG